MRTLRKILRPPFPFNETHNFSKFFSPTVIFWALPSLFQLVFWALPSPFQLVFWALPSLFQLVFWAPSLFQRGLVQLWRELTRALRTFPRQERTRNATPSLWAPPADSPTSAQAWRASPVSKNKVILTEFEFFDTLTIVEYERLRLFLYENCFKICFSLAHSFAYVAHFVFLRDVWIRTQRAIVASRRATKLTTVTTLIDESALRSLILYFGVCSDLHPKFGTLATKCDLGSCTVLNKFMTTNIFKTHFLQKLKIEHKRLRTVYS